MKNISKKDISYLSLFSAITICGNIFETIIPKPYPFLRIGIANIPILILIYHKKYYFALFTTLSKSIIAPIILGIIFTIQPLISLFASLCAFLFMVFAKQFIKGLSIIGVSILGALTSNMMQIYLVYLFIFRTTSIYKLVSPFILLSILSGSLTGIFAIKLKRVLPIKKIV